MTCSRVTPINEAEAIIDPLWDPQQSGFPAWRVVPGAEHGLRVAQNWCWVEFEWARKPEADPALRMSRRYDIECEDYDSVVVSVMAPEGSIIRLIATTDRGEVVFVAPPAPPLKKEHALSLEGATRLGTLTIEIEPAADGVAAGWLNWIGLCNSALLPVYEERWRRLGRGWEVFLQPEDYAPRFQPTYGLLFGSDELERIRVRHAAVLAARGSTPFADAARQATNRVPEQMVREHVNFWGDTRYCRERDHGNVLMRHGMNAAIAGILTRDASLLRLAARYALAIGLCEHWDDGMICRFPGSAWEHRCFVQSLCVHEVALILDLAGEMFTDAGRDFLMRRIAEEGLAAIDYSTWRHPYIFHCNQLAWFTPGRMMGSVLLEKAWPRVKSHTDIARADLLESMDDAILPDGGYVEGPTYFRMMSEFAGLALLLYSRARGTRLADAIPTALRRTSVFAQALVSTDDAQDVIPICDASALSGCDMPAVMASVLPASAWTGMYRKSVAHSGGSPDSLLALLLDDSIPAESPPPEPFVYLPDMGLMASTRKLGDATVKLLILGNRAGAGHTHEDKGSFVLEFAGETFAMDPGTCDYASPLAGLLKNCERHNMLVPTGLDERPHPACPLPVDVKPRGQGDETAFRAEIDAAPGWDGLYTRWHRTWDSPTPGRLTITDEWSLSAGTGVEFCWQTRLPVELASGVVVLRGSRGRALIEVLPGVTARVDELPLLDGVQRRIAFRVDATAGRMTVAVLLERA